MTIFKWLREKLRQETEKHPLDPFFDGTIKAPSGPRFKCSWVNTGDMSLHYLFFSRELGIVLPETDYGEGFDRVVKEFDGTLRFSSDDLYYESDEAFFADLESQLTKKGAQ